jgi:hypothetical protein
VNSEGRPEKKKKKEEGEKREAGLAMVLAMQSFKVAVLWWQWCCFKWQRERPEREMLLFFSSPIFSFFLFYCVSLSFFFLSVRLSPISFSLFCFVSLLSIISISSFFH